MDLKRRRSSDKHIDHLIDYMIKHKKFSSGKFQGHQGKKFLAEMWQRLCQELNEIGPRKDVEQWKKVWKNQKLLTRKRNSEIKLSQKRTGNFTPPPPLTERESKIISMIGKESSEGLGLSEGAIGEEMSTASNIHEFLEPQQSSHIPNFLEDMEMENIYIINDENEVELEIGSDAPTGSKENGEEKENKLVTGKKQMERNRETKTLQENNLFKNLIETNSEGLYAIARSLELVAASNNNIAIAITSFNNSNK